MRTKTILFFLLLVISALVGCSEGRGVEAEPAATATPVPVSISIEVGAEGAELADAAAPSIYLPPDSTTEETVLHIEEVVAPASPEEYEAASAAYEINLDQGVLTAPVEIALPVDAALLEQGDSMFIAYFDEENGWVSLPSWYSEEDGKVHAITNHFTLFRAFLSILPIKPKIDSIIASPNPIQGVGNPACFEDNLGVLVEAHDPNGDIVDVRLRLQVYTFASEMLTEAMRETQAIFGLGLVMYSGGIAGILPASQTVLTLASTEDPGRAASDWASMSAVEGEPGLYANSIDLSPMSTCEGDSFDVDSVMAGTGINRFEVIIQVEDNSGKVVEKVIEVLVHNSELPYAELQSPVINEVVSNLPLFEWDIYHFGESDYEQKLVFAKGDNLWDRWWGKTSIDLDWNDQHYQVEVGEELKPGDYVWGIEVTSREGTTRSSVQSFTVPKYWAELSVEGEVVRREEVPANLDSLTWNVTLNGEDYLNRNALDETVLNLRDFHSEMEDGVYTFWLSSVYGNEYHVISNKVSFEIISTPLSAELNVSRSDTNWIPGNLRQYSSASSSAIIFGECADVEWHIEGGGASSAQLNGEPVDLIGSKVFCVVEDTRLVLDIFKNGEALDTVRDEIDIQVGRPGIVSFYRFSGSSIVGKGGAYCYDFGIMGKLNQADQYFEDHPMAFAIYGFGDGYAYYFFTEEAEIACR